MKDKNPITIGKFDSVYTGTKRIHRSTNSWWLKKITLLIFLVGFSSLDGFTLYPVFEYLFSSSPTVLYATTFGTAVAINFLPCIAARFYLHSKYGLQEKNYSMFFATLGFFSVIFVTLGCLRFATANEVIANSSAYMSSSSGDISASSGKSGSIPMILVQITTNLLTSAIAFFLSYFSENPLKMRMDAIELQIVDFEERSIALECAAKELSMYDYDKMLEHEMNKCALAHEALTARGDALKIESDKQLEMILNSADANTVITDAQKAEDAARNGQSSADNNTLHIDNTPSNIFTTKEVS